MKFLCRFGTISAAIILLLSTPVDAGNHAGSDGKPGQFRLDSLHTAAGFYEQLTGCGAKPQVRSTMKIADVHELAHRADDFYSCASEQLALGLTAVSRQLRSGEAAIYSAAVSNLQLKIEADRRRATTPSKFYGLNWGIGFGFSIGRDDFIESAEIVDGVVRVTKDNTQQPRAVFEFHKYFGCKLGRLATESHMSGCGPFVAVAGSGDDLLSGVGLGLMYGLKSKDPGESDGFSIGIGAILDRDVKSLASGFTQDLAAPPGSSSVLLEEKSRWSWLVFVTRTF